MVSSADFRKPLGSPSGPRSTVRTSRLALRILQNRTGLVPRPSWCTFQLRSNGPDMKEMKTNEIRKVFRELGELDLVRISGPEPSQRPDFDDVIHIILEESHPSVFQLATDGQDPDRIVALSSTFGDICAFRWFVFLGDAIAPNVHESSQQKIFASAMSTLRRLRLVSHDKKLEVMAVIDVGSGSSPEEITKTRALLGDIGVQLIVIPFSMGIAGTEVFPRRCSQKSILDAELVETEKLPKNLMRTALRYFLRGAINRLESKPRLWPRPRCTSLRSHVHVASDGTIPTCGHYSTPVGSLRDDDFNSVWFGMDAEKARQIVDSCQGCWSVDESIPNALYTGELIRKSQDSDSLEDRSRATLLS